MGHLKRFCAGKGLAKLPRWQYHGGKGHVVVIDIVIPFYNQGAKLRACLRSLDASLAAGARVYVVDDASQPEEAAAARAVLASMKSTVQMLTHPENRGFRDAVTTGIEAGDGEHVILLNSDTIVTPGFADLLVDVMRQSPEIAAVAPVSNTNADLFQYRAGFPEAEGDGAGLARAVIAFAKERRMAHAGRVTEAHYLTGMCLALERRTAEAAGWFGTDYVHGYFEDLDLCCRLRAAGKRLAIREDCFVYHAGHASYAAADRGWLVPTLMNNYRLFSARWGHMEGHDDLMRLIRTAGQTESIGTRGEAAHV